MPKKELIEYIKRQLNKGHSPNDIRSILLRYGHKKADIDEAFKSIPKEKAHKSIKKIWIVIAVIMFLLMLVGAFFYFKYISPISVKKPEIMLPDDLLMDNSALRENKIESRQISYLVNEIGGYKLHNDPINSEKPIIEFKITDTQEVFIVEIEKNYPKAEKGTANSPDLRISANSDTIKKLLSSDKIASDMVAYVEKGEIVIEVLKDETTLAIKGYKSIYDSVMKNSGMPTGRFIMAFNNNLIWKN